MIDYPEMTEAEERVPRLNLSEEERDKIARRLCSEIDAWETRRNALKARWDKHEQLYACDESATSLNSVEGIGTYPVSLWRPKCDAAKGDLVGSVLSANPIVQCIEEGPDGSNEGNIEKALMQLSERARFPQVFPLAVHTAFNTNTGVIRTRTTTDKEGNVNGVESDWFHPKHVCFYPAAVERVSQCRTVGHRFHQGLWEIEEKQSDGLYFKFEPGDEVVAGDDPDRDNHLPGRFDRVHQAGNDVVDPEDGFVECWEMVTRHKIDGEWKLILVVLARSSQKLLNAQEYPYSRAWYDIVRPLQTEKNILTNDSVAQGVQGYCLAAQDLLNAIVGGAYMTAYPVVWMKGAALGPNQAKQYSAAEIIPLGPDGEMGTIGLPFDANKFGAALEKFEQLVDSTIGISRISSSQNLPSDTKATAINALVAGDERRQATYLDAAAEAVEGVFGLLFEYLRKHKRELGEKLGGAVAAVSPDALEKAYRLEVTGRSGASNPNTILQKLQFLMTAAQNPQSTLDYGKVENRAIDALDLPFDTQALMKNWLSEVTAMVTRMEGQGIDPMQALTMGVQAMVNEQSAQNGDPSTAISDPGMVAPDAPYSGEAIPDGGELDPMLSGAIEGAPGGDSTNGPLPNGGDQAPYDF